MESREDFFEEYGSLAKRPCYRLRLTKSLSLFNLIKNALSQTSSASIRANPIEISDHRTKKDKERIAAASGEVSGHGTKKDKERIVAASGEVSGHGTKKDKERIVAASGEVSGHGTKKDKERIADASSEVSGHGTKKDKKRIADASSEVSSHGTKKDKERSASRFQSSLLRIGSWEYIPKYKHHLVAKISYINQKIVWEVLDGGLKKKMEIEWCDIMGVKADLSDVYDEPGSLTLVLSRQPAFFREIDPQPRKHTEWKATTDFTDGQATLNKRHILQCPSGLLKKPYEKLIQCDERLGMLSRQPEIVVDSPYFESQASESSQLHASEFEMNYHLTAGNSMPMNDTEINGGIFEQMSTQFSSTDMNFLDNLMGSTREDYSLADYFLNLPEDDGMDINLLDY